MTDVFVDTNVLIYAEESLSAHHAAARACLIRLEAEGAVLWISRQVLREYLAVMTRPSAGAAGIAPLTAAHAIAAIARLQDIFAVAEDGARTTEALLDRLRRYRVQGRAIHDANIVATMRAHGIGRLLTFNVADFRRYADMIALEPIASAMDA